ncbi:MAG: hypothetical protein QOK47_583 [Actinomycetota bacterium]|nr:hypothetical protein [Actinomycetota bacterium]
MKKLIAIAAIAASITTSFVGGPASAAKKPVQTSLFLHGTEAIGEMESLPAVADAYLRMDPTEPADSTPKSKLITNYGVGPNATCAGNNLFPVWIGTMSGRIKGDMKLTFSSLGTPGPVEIRVWGDVLSQACDSASTGTFDYVDPAGSVVVDLPPGPGTVEAVIKGLDLKVTTALMLQVSPVILLDIPDPGGYVLNPFVNRILYDAPDYASVLEFNCIPTTGKTCATS